MARQSGQGSPPGATVVRWLWIWITLGILVVVVVIGFLIGITRALGSIDDGLFEAASSVEAIGTNADPLPSALEKINTALGSVDTTLKPIGGQAVEIGTGLGKIRDSLKSIDGSLKDTGGSLVDTNGSLGNTSGVLVNVAGTTSDIDSSLADTSNLLDNVFDNADKIESKLEDAQNKDSRGTELIPVNVDRANDVLGPIREDTKAIAGGLKDVNRNLSAICNSPLLMTLPPFMLQQCPTG